MSDTNGSGEQGTDGGTGGDQGTEQNGTGQQGGDQQGGDQGGTGGTGGDQGTGQQGGEQQTGQQGDKGGSGKGVDEKGAKALRDEAAKHRTGKAAAEKQRDEATNTLAALRKLLDPNAKDDEDPADTAKRAVSEAEQTRAELKAERLERAAERTARRLGVDEVALLDSRVFLGKLAELDPTADGFGDALEQAVNAAVGANPRLKQDAAPSRQQSGSADMSGGGEASKGATTIDDRRKQRRERRTG